MSLIKKGNSAIPVDKYPFFCDKRLSLRARGLLGQVLTLPETENWKVDDLISEVPEGKNAVYKIIQELKKIWLCRDC